MKIQWKLEALLSTGKKYVKKKFKVGIGSRKNFECFGLFMKFLRYHQVLL